MKRTIGKVLQWLGLLCTIVSFLIFAWVDDSITIDEDFKGVLLIGTMIGVGLSVKIYFTGKRLYRSVVKINIHDKRPPVIFLRNFIADKSGARGKMNWLFRLNFFGGSPNLVTEEEQIAEAMNHYGPFIGIGKPGEFLPRLGADRIYVDNEHWQEKVKTMIHESVFVLFRASDSNGLLWELETALQLKPFQGIIILVPEAEKEFICFRDTFLRLTGIPLPAIDFSRKSAHTFRGVIWFDRNKMAFYEDMSFGKSNSIFSMWKLSMTPWMGIIRNTASAGLKKIMTAPAKELNLKVDQVTRASRSSRVKASLADSLIIIAVVLILILILPKHIRILSYDFNSKDDIFPLILMLYIIGFESIAPFATPGKRLMKIYVKDEENVNPAIFQILTRLCIKIFSFILIFGFYNLYKNKRLLHDIYARTDVFARQVP